MKLDRTVWNILKFGSLLVILALCPFLIWQKFENEDWFRYWWLIFAPVITIFLLLVWYAVFGSGSVGKRILKSFLGLLGFIGLFALFFALFEYDGSSGGGSFPKYKFRFSSADDEGTEPVSSPIPGKTGKTEVNVEIPEGAMDSPQFLGPGRDGVYSDARVSLDFSANPPEELWRIPVGDGWSSFSVVGGRAITQEQRGEDELITCYKLATGELLWAHTDENTRFVSASTNEKKENRTMAVMGGEGPRSTPTIHENRVFSLGSTGILNCLDLKTGELIWTRDTLAEFSALLPRWGKSAAPLVVADLNLVIVSAAESNGPTLLAYQLETGEPVWEYEGNGASYSSPRIITLGGERQLVSVNGFDVTSHDPATGLELWRFDWPRENPKVGQPIQIGDDRILVSASYNMGSHLIRVQNDEEKWTVEPVWKSIRLKTKFSSSLVKGDHAYGLNEGRLACINLEDGSQAWRGGKYGYGQNLLINDENILILAENGDIAVVKADPAEFIETAKIEGALTGMTWNAPTLAGRYLLVRNGAEAVCYRLAEK